MSFKLGIDVDDLTVYLYRDADFTTTLTEKDGPWGEDAQVYLLFPRDDAVWHATIEANLAIFEIAKSVVNQRLSKESVELWVADSTSAACWAAGTAVKRGN